MKLSAATLAALAASAIQPHGHGGGAVLVAAASSCLEARMSSSNDGTYPNANGFVTVCFDGSLNSATGGSFDMYVENLNASTTGGVHIHSGKWPLSI